MTTEEKLRLKVCQCFQGPVHQTFVFAYYQTYTQDTDVYSYATKSGLDKYFSDRELSVLQREKRPNYQSLPLLYKVTRVFIALLSITYYRY